MNSKTSEEKTDNFNHLFPSALSRFASSRKILLLFSETDRLYWEFEEKYLSRYSEEFKKISDNIDIKITKDANHIYSFKEWQKEMLDDSCRWLEKQYQTTLVAG